MAAVTAVSGAVGAATGVAKFFEGRSMQKRAEKFIENFEWQDLQNPYRNQQVSTLGADLLKEQANIASATDVEALRAGGTRALAGGLGRVDARRNVLNREIASNLDEQQKAINASIANQEAVNQNMVEKRQTDELAGYGQMMNVGMGTKYQGLTNVVNGLGAMGQGLQGIDFGGGGNSGAGTPSAGFGMNLQNLGSDNASLYPTSYGIS